MAVLLAYIFVVLIWATTPLAIQWSNDSVSFAAAALLRMAFALALGLLINFLLRRKLFFHPRVWQIYAAGAISIFPNLPVVYWSAQFIPSGLVAVIFAMSPFVTGLMTFFVLKENPFSLRRIVALLIAVFGLALIFHNQFKLGAHAVYGIVGILVSCFLFSFSSVLVKKINLAATDTLVSSPDAFNQALGSLLFSLPGLALLWWLLDGVMPLALSMKSLMAISYLAIFGSLVGFTLFFLVLRNMSPSAVSLITFMTPVLALLLGAWVGHEVLPWQLWCGAFLIVIALLLYLDLSGAEWLWRALTRPQWREDSLSGVKNSYQKFK